MPDGGRTAAAAATTYRTLPRRPRRMAHVAPNDLCNQLRMGCWPSAGHHLAIARPARDLVLAIARRSDKFTTDGISSARWPEQVRQRGGGAWVADGGEWVRSRGEEYGPFNAYIPIRSTTIGKSRVAKDPITMHTSWRSNSDIASVTSIGYPRMRASGESSTTKHRLLHASGPHPIPPPNDPKIEKRKPKEFGQKAAQSRHIRVSCSLDRFDGGSTEPDLSSAHNQSNLTTCNTVADQIESEKEKTRRADYNRSKVKIRSAQSWIRCEEKISSELDKLRRAKSDLRSTEAEQRNQMYSAHMLKVNEACRSIKYKGHKVQLVRRLFQREETCVQRIDLHKGFIYQRETEIENYGEQEDKPEAKMSTIKTEDLIVTVDS
ncbi:hypothetical protein F511_27338 [Dorcoceras hygrometricum]|uniref:Uncharacterized protein n=1 Tax=Dorcoceras hygrometricum TaxID=472368 RepID=A0A2Z7ALB2_9LAMI|nr:hypothetical protein F511_27338 [Dorcoceras hygrometricum]